MVYTKTYMLNLFLLTIFGPIYYGPPVLVGLVLLVSYTVCVNHSFKYVVSNPPFSWGGVDICDPFSNFDMVASVAAFSLIFVYAWLPRRER